MSWMQVVSCSLVVFRPDLGMTGRLVLFLAGGEEVLLIYLC